MQTKWIAIALALAFLATATPTTAGPLEDLGVVERHLVGFYAMPDVEVGDTYQGEKVVAVDHDLAFVVIETATYPLFALRVKQDDNVRYVEPDASEHQLQFTPNDPLYGDAGMYGVKVTKINLAWDVTLGSTAVRISVIDSGITKTHEDAGGSRILTGLDAIEGKSVADSSQCSYHGSHTAGTAAASTNNGKGVSGVAQATINPIKIFKKGGFGGCSTTTTAIVKAFKYSGDQGDHVSSNSWGGGGSSTAINDAIKYALDKGVTVVGAAGNSGSCTNCVGQPWKDMGSTAGVIVVSCSDSADKFCSFSSEGPQVDVAAPGYSILSIAGGTSASYKRMSGTSMSTPHVAGVAALVLTTHSSYSPGQVESAIKSSADSLGLSSDRQGAGRLDGQGAIA